MKDSDIIQRYGQNSLLALFGITSKKFRDILDMWKQPHRYYHGINHLSTLLERIDDHIELSRDKVEILELIALFHDVVYDPRSKTNEELSAQYFTACCTALSSLNEKFRIIKQAILDTKIVLNPNPSHLLSELFLRFDVDELCYGTISKVIENEYLIHREFQMYDLPFYIKGRSDFMDSLLKRKDIGREEKNNIDLIIGFLSSFRPKIGLYAGSFNPFHVGHLNVVEQAEKIFDKVVIAQGKNSGKALIDNFRNFEYDVPFHHIIKYDGFLHQVYMRLSQSYDVTLVRGLRNGSDLQYEMNLLRTLQDAIPDIKVIFLVCDCQYEHISSTICRDVLSRHNSDVNWSEKYISNKYRYKTGDDTCHPIIHN